MPAPKTAPEPSRRPPPPRATPSTGGAAAPAPKGATPAAPPRAGGGPEGGRGTDVANVNVRGLEFPFPGYLQNIVRQVALRFAPPNRDAALQADVAFLIHRDGSVSGVRLVKRSGSYAFDLEAQGAVEAVGAARAFGPLPEAFRDDVLPVTFSFDPRVIR
jgi:protein TonB